MVNHKARLHIFKKIGIISFISHHDGTKIEISNKRNLKNCTNTWKLNKMVLNNQWLNEEIEGKLSFLI
jgi:hypothetical protein